MTTKTDGDRLLRAAVDLLAAPGWASRARTYEPLAALVEEIAPGRLTRARATAKRKAVERIEAARWTGPVPAWAKRLVTKYISDFRVVWRPERRDSSSGRCFWDHFTVNAGTDVVDQRRVVLHEIAHALTNGHGHDETFWDEAYRLSVAEGMVESMKARSNQKRSFTAAQRRARRS